MNDEQISIAIAEACGWTYRLVPSDAEIEAAREGTGPYAGMKGYPIGGGPMGGMQFKWWRKPSGEEVSDCPDYCHDLNAMAEAELIFFDPAKAKLCNCFLYLQTLRDVVRNGREDLTFDETLMLMVRAKSSQRAEAFLRTIGKWKD